MGVVVWKKFVLKETFKRNSPPHTDSTAKELNIFDEPGENTVALITRAESNNGIRGYIEKGDFPTLKKGITYNDQFSLFLFHNYEFTTIKDHLSVVTAIDKKLQLIMDENNSVCKFITTLLNHIFSKKIFNFNFTGADYRYDREIVLLPCMEISNNEEYIWEENGHYYTLAIDYIENIMEKVQEIKEEKTIRMYESEKTKYESERKKYETEYKKEKEQLVWVSFKLDDLFNLNSNHKLSKVAKEYDIVSEFENGYVANVTAGKYNNGIAGFILENDEINNKKRINELTISTNGAGVGSCFYHDYYFVSTGDNKIVDSKNDKLHELIATNRLCGKFIAKIITHIFTKGIFNWSYKVNDLQFSRETIVLPCLEVNGVENCVWDNDGHYYTLATSYISYLYLTGIINTYQNLINKYKSQY